MEKLDFKKLMAPVYSPSAKQFELVDVPEMAFVMVDGAGDPNTSETYARAVNWLFSVSYALKFMARATVGSDYTVMPLEGLWWAQDLATFISGRKDQWLWTMMVMTPEFVTADLYSAAVEQTRKKLGSPPASLRLQRFAEGLAVQILHIGSYDSEAPTIARLHAEYLPSHGLVEAGHHHEIYLSDPRKTEAAKLRTILRQPVRRA